MERRRRIVNAGGCPVVRECLRLCPACGTGVRGHILGAIFVGCRGARRGQLLPPLRTSNPSRTFFNWVYGETQFPPHTPPASYFLHDFLWRSSQSERRSIVGEVLPTWCHAEPSSSPSSSSSSTISRPPPLPSRPLLSLLSPPRAASPPPCTRTATAKLPTSSI